MKKVNSCRLVFKTWRRFGVCAFVFLVIASYCLFSAITSFAEINNEQQEPYALTITADSLTDTDIVSISELADVVNVTPIYNVPAEASIGDETLELPVMGIDGSYIEHEFLYGDIFPETSAMPYVVINRFAAQEHIKDTEDIESALAGLIGKQIILNINEKQYTAMIAGIFEDNTEEAKAYISLSSAKNLLMNSGTIPALYSCAYIRCVNAGKTEAITQEIERLGFLIDNPNTELENKWKDAATHNTYLCLLSALAIASAISLMYQKSRSDNLVCGVEREALTYSGLTRTQFKTITAKRVGIFIVLALTIGILIALIADSFEKI